MLKFYYVIVLCYFCLLLFLIIKPGDANDHKNVQQRQKRFLRFQNTSRYFLRLNFKANMVPWTQIFAQALGFRLNWDDPPDNFHPYHKLYRRDAYTHLATLLDMNGLDGRRCIRRAICEMRMIAEPRGIYQRILKIVFRESLDTTAWHNMSSEECHISTHNCPFSLLNVARYTDL